MTRASSPWLIAVTAGRWQLNGIRSAQAAGIRVFAIDADRNAPSLALADHALCAPIDDWNTIKEAILKAGISPSGGVSFCSEAGIPAVASLRKQFGLPGPQGEELLALFRKEEQRAAWESAGVPIPRWAVFQSPRECEEQVKQIGYPCIIKPTDSAGSRGVSVLSNSANSTAQAARHALDFSKAKKGVVESYFRGTEYTVETFSQGSECHVLAVTQKKKVSGSSDTVASELRTVSPSDQKYAKLAEATRSALKALGLPAGPGHTELILSSDQSLIVVETAPRGGGFNVFDRMIPAVSGFDIARATAEISIGRHVRIPQLKSNAAILRFFPSQPGKVICLRGFDENWGRPSDFSGSGVEAGAFVEVGHESGTATTDGDRLGYVLSWAEDIGKAEELADERENQVEIEIMEGRL